MISLDDPRWKELKGGYKVLYDPTPALRKLEQGSDVWKELWNNLHHQGTVDLASYAAVPYLVRIGTALPQRDWNLYSLVSTIETERFRATNPILPDWLQNDYENAWQDLFKAAQSDLGKTNDLLIIRSILGVLALARGALKLGALIADLDGSEIDEYLDNQMNWSAFYDSHRRPLNTDS